MTDKSTEGSPAAAPASCLRLRPVRRRLGLPSTTLVAVANMIGAGVFTTSGFALANLGRPGVVLLAWVVGGGIALLGALSYGALASRIPESGGEYTLLSQTLHPLAGFLAGWVSLLAGFTAPIAVAALALQAYLFGDSLAVRPEWIGTGAILLAAGLHGVRLQAGVVIQNIVVVLKLGLVIGLIGFGLQHVGASPPLPIWEERPPFELGAFAVTLVWVSFSYSGWNAAVYFAGEVRDPERNLWRSMVLATVFVSLLYVGLNAVFLYAAPAAAIAGHEDVGAIAAEAIGGAGLRRIVALVVALALFTSISAMVMIGPRVYERMSEDGYLPRWFRRSSSTPSAAIFAQAGLAILVLWLSELAQLLGYIGFTLGISAAGTVIGLLVLRRKEGPVRVPIPGYPVVPVAFVVLTLSAAAWMALRLPGQAGFGLATVAAGLPLYAYGRRRHRAGP